MYFLISTSDKVTIREYLVQADNKKAARKQMKQSLRRGEKIKGIGPYSLEKYKEYIQRVVQNHPLLIASQDI